jgi:hypothetical protein
LVIPITHENQPLQVNIPLSGTNSSYHFTIYLTDVMRSMRNKRLESSLSTVSLISQEADREQQKKQIRQIPLGGLGASYHRVACM